MRSFIVILCAAAFAFTAAMTVVLVTAPMRDEPPPYIACTLTDGTVIQLREFPSSRSMNIITTRREVIPWHRIEKCELISQPL